MDERDKAFEKAEKERKKQEVQTKKEEARKEKEAAKQRKKEEAQKKKEEARVNLETSAFFFFARQAGPPSQSREPNLHNPHLPVAALHEAYIGSQPVPTSKPGLRPRYQTSFIKRQ